MRLFRKLYDWVLHWAETPYGLLALFLLALAESSFFPVPPDALLIALCLGAIKKSWRFAFYTSLASVLGGMLGYLIGYGLFDWISHLGFVLLLITAAVMIPCCFSDIIFPLLLTRKNQP